MYCNYCTFCQNERPYFSVHTKNICRNIRELPLTRSDSSQTPSVTPLIRGNLRNPLVSQLVKKSAHVFVPEFINLLTRTHLKSNESNLRFHTTCFIHIICLFIYLFKNYFNIIISCITGAVKLSCTFKLSL